MLKIHRVSSVKVCPDRNLVGIPIPDSPNIICCNEAERVGALSEPIEVGVCRQLGTETQILRLEDQIRASCVEDRLRIVAALDGK